MIRLTAKTSIKTKSQNELFYEKLYNNYKTNTQTIERRWKLQTVKGTFLTLTLWWLTKVLIRPRTSNEYDIWSMLHCTTVQFTYQYHVRPNVAPDLIYVFKWWHSTNIRLYSLEHGCLLHYYINSWSSCKWKEALIGHGTVIYSNWTRGFINV